MVTWSTGRSTVNTGGRICVSVDRLLSGKSVSDVSTANQPDLVKLYRLPLDPGPTCRTTVSITIVIWTLNML